MGNSLVILAAGVGSRYGGLKQLEKIGPHGESLIEYSIYNAIKAGYASIVMIIRRETEELFNDFFKKKLPSDICLQYVYQDIDTLPSGYSAPANRKKPWGTGHAVLLSKEYVTGNFTMINGDDYYAYEALQVSHEFLLSCDTNSTQYLNLCYRLGNTLSRNGSVSRGVCKVDSNNILLDIEEHKKIEYVENGKIYSVKDTENEELSSDAIASMNLMSFTPTIFSMLEEGFDAFLNKHIHEEKSEFLMPAYLGELSMKNKVEIYVIQTSVKWYGITYKEDKEKVQEGISSLIKNGDIPSILW